MKTERLITIQTNEQIKLPVVYYCFRDFRIHENWNIIMGMEKAKEMKTSFRIVYIIPQRLTRRKHNFIMNAIEECVEKASDLNIVTELVSENNFMRIKHSLSHHFFDFHPTLSKKYIFENKINTITTYCTKYPGHVYCIDTHNIVPCWYVSNKAEYSARFFRQKVEKYWTEFLEEFPPLTPLPNKRCTKLTYNTDGIIVLEDSKALNIIGTYEKAKERLEYMLSNIDAYPEVRSHLSPYINYGIISTQEIIRQLPYMSLFGSFLDQVFIRRELSDNFCYYKDPNDLNSLSNWIVSNIEKHRMDIREHILTLEDLEMGRSPDDTWNSIQHELVTTGRLVGDKRMYWAKMFAYWTSNIEEAISFCLYLNDKYQLDGDVPAGIVNILWSLVGLHDRTFKETPILGRVRKIKKKPKV